MHISHSGKDLCPDPSIPRPIKSASLGMRLRHWYCLKTPQMTLKYRAENYIKQTGSQKKNLHRRWKYKIPYVQKAVYSLLMNFLWVSFPLVNLQLLHIGKLTESPSVDFASLFGMCGLLTSCPEHSERQPRLNLPRVSSGFLRQWGFP